MSAELSLTDKARDAWAGFLAEAPISRAPDGLVSAVDLAAAPNPAVK